MSLLKKLFKSTEETRFSDMSKKKQLQTVRDDVDKLKNKKINMKGLKR
jgi:hypothetical protein